MSEHPAAERLHAMADGELGGAELTAVQAHLAGCPACTSAALAASLMKGATARAGMRYAVPDELRERMQRLAAGEGSATTRKNGFNVSGWGAIAALIVMGAALFLVQGQVKRSADTTALVAEVADQHIATMAGNAPPEVVSSDRHTVKPWFQGKLPFSFNLPENLPGDTTLDGADLTYLHGQPAAQLLYSIGKHRVSVFVQQRSGRALPGNGDRSGFHVVNLAAGELEVVAVSDVEAGQLAGLAEMVAKAQAAR